MSDSLNNAFNWLLQKSLHLLSGAIAGCVSRSAVAPIERIIILRQTSNADYQGLSMMRCMGRMYSQEGLPGLFRGNGATCIRIAPFQATEFFVFDYYRFYARALIDHYNLQVSQTGVNLITGAMSGMTASSVVYPIDLVRTLLASQTSSCRKYTGIFSSITTVYRETGILSLYKGWGTTMVGIAPYASCKLTCFQSLKTLSADSSLAQHYPIMANLAMGALAGSFAVTVTYPTDLLRKKMQVQVLHGQSDSLGTVIRRLASEEGVSGFYRGLGATYVKVLPSTALAFAINEALKKIMGVVGPKKE